MKNFNTSGKNDTGDYTLACQLKQTISYGITSWFVGGNKHISTLGPTSFVFGGKYFQYTIGTQLHYWRAKSTSFDWRFNETFLNYNVVIQRKKEAAIYNSKVIGNMREICSKKGVFLNNSIDKINSSLSNKEEKLTRVDTRISTIKKQNVTVNRDIKSVQNNLSKISNSINSYSKELSKINNNISDGNSYISTSEKCYETSDFYFLN